MLVRNLVTNGSIIGQVHVTSEGTVADAELALQWKSPQGGASREDPGPCRYSAQRVSGSDSSRPGGKKLPGNSASKLTLSRAFGTLWFENEHDAS